MTENEGHTDLWQFKIVASRQHGEDMLAPLEEFSEAISFFEDEQKTDRWVIQGTCTHEPLEHRIVDIINDSAERTHPDFHASLDILKLPHKDWLAENRRAFAPIVVGPLYIHDSHHASSQDPDMINLCIDASTAFGTGSHETTRGCLEVLCALRDKGLTVKNALDIGTGTGILAFAMRLLFDAPVIATDLDPLAVEKVRYNAIVNVVHDNFDIFQADGVEHPTVAAQAPFDLITANILLSPLIEHAESIKSILAPGGVLVLSGITADQAETLKRAYEDQGVSVQDEHRVDTWSTLVLKRSGPRGIVVDNRLIVAEGASSDMSKI